MDPAKGTDLNFYHIVCAREESDLAESSAWGTA